MGVGVGNFLSSVFMFCEGVVFTDYTAMGSLTEEKSKCHVSADQIRFMSGWLGHHVRLQQWTVGSGLR